MATTWGPKRIEGKRGTTWRVGWRDHLARAKSRTFKSEREARIFVRTIDGELAQGIFNDPNRGRERLAKWWATFEAEYIPTLKPKTQVGYRDHWRRFVAPHLGSYRLMDLEQDPGIIVNWIQRIETTPSSKKCALVALQSVLAYALFCGRIGRNPAVGLGKALPKRERTEPHPWAPAQIRQIAETVKPRYRSIVELIGYHGLRPSEVVALRMGDLYLVDPIPHLIVRRAAPDVAGHVVEGALKTDRSRGRVDLLPFVVDGLVEHVARFVTDSDDEGLVFAGELNGRILHVTFINDRVVKPAMKKLGFEGPGVNAYSLKHSAVSNIVAVTGSIDLASRMVRHTSSRTTERHYTHLQPTHLAPYLDAIAEAFGRR